MPAEDYTRVSKLGSGAFGVVYQVRHKNGTIYAMKEAKDSGNFASQIQELAALRALKGHPYIVQYVEYFEKQTNLCIVMEFCNSGNLENYIIKEKRSDQVLLTFMKQMADAIQYSHSKGIVHRDLKPENVMITMNNGELIAKIADFGVAKIKFAGYLSLPSSGLPLQSYMHTGAGTCFYMAPEVFNRHYTEKADVFSLGVMFCAILERKIFNVPGHGKWLGIFFSDSLEEPIGVVLHRNPNAVRQLDPKVTIPEESRNLINSMIRASYKSRPSAKDVHETLQSASDSYCCIL